MLAVFFSILLSNRTCEVPYRQAIDETVSLIAERISVIIPHEPTCAGKTRCIYQSTVGFSRMALMFQSLQDAQNGRSARPQRARRRGVRFGTLSL